ncbi:MAG: twin-arginine translocase subunit TatC [Bacteroidales bacterium]|nr:twin-arginine translocase subunit TatC [Bacteroidales bacterium]
MKSHEASTGLHFWEHFDVLRRYLLRVCVLCLVFSVVAFIFKEYVFAVLLAPMKPDFFVYSWFDSVQAFFSSRWNGAEIAESMQEVQLINTELANQFLMHIKASFAVGVVCASPYILFALFRFVSPALYAHERRATLLFCLSSYLLFVCGVLLSYFIIFPFTFRFLSSYSVSTSVVNFISLESYMQSLFAISLLMGVMFEIPILCWILAKLGIIRVQLMKHYRRHAIVAIVVVAAIITPTGDAFTLALVSLPLCLLYELSIRVVQCVEKQRAQAA